jgi:hypothetical protein
VRLQIQLILYQVLKRYADRNAAEPYWQVSATELRDLLGCSVKLKDWKDFRRTALNPAIEEIGQIAEFSVDLSEVRQGRGRGGGKVISVVFYIRKKGSNEAAETVRAWSAQGPAPGSPQDDTEFGVKGPEGPTVRNRTVTWIRGFRATKGLCLKSFLR